MKHFFIRMRRRHFEGRGGIGELLPIAVPMFISSIFDMLMMFIDRLFLARVGVIHQAAAMSGGIMAWTVCSFFAGIISYSSALTAQYHGAGQKHNCAVMTRQALLFAFAGYPLVLLADLLVAASPLFSVHTPLQQLLERRYFWYMAFGAIFSLLRFAIASFFTGIGRTRIILAANMAALLVNIVANRVLIFGCCGLPPLGLDGAAVGTLLSSVVTVLILAAAFRRVRRQREWSPRPGKFFDGEKFGKLLRYGLPQGCENVLAVFCFAFLVSTFHSYGEEMAAATTIVFNWDGFSFHPLLGIQVAVTTLVGRALGKGSPSEAVRAAHSGFKTAVCYALFMIVVFVGFTRVLVGVFTPDIAGLDYSPVREYALPMLRLAGLYLLTDAVSLTCAGVLRGAGDTLVCMFIRILNNGINAAVIGCCVYLLKMPPLQVWLVFVVLGMGYSVAFVIRYRRGRWKRLRLVAAEAAHE